MGREGNTELKSFKQFILEADTSSATNEEDAIVYVYNKHKGYSHEDALANGLMDENDFLKLTPVMLKIAEDIYLKNLSKGNRGDAMKMAGEKSGPNHYDGATDNTSKADFYGNKKNQISLKQSDDKSGAQLISSKSEEAAGCVNAAILHYQENDGEKLKKNKAYKEAMDILENKMLESARTDVVVPIKAGKRNIKDWYITDSGRKDFLVKKLKKAYPGKKGEERIIKHMKYELQILNALGKTTGWKKNALPEIPKAKGNSASFTWKKDMVQPNAETMKNKIFAAFISSTTDLNLTGTSPKGKEKKGKGEKKYLPSDMAPKDVKKQITEMMSVAIDSMEWKDKLTKFFTQNEDLKKWVVYEAGSGLYKFTGQISDGKDYVGDNWRVANRMLVFTGGKGGGFNKEYASVMSWSKKNGDLVNHMDISYKGQGKGRYIKFGIPTKMPKKTNESVFLDATIDECIQYELPSLNEEIRLINEQYLTEGIFGKAIEKIKGLGSVVSDYAIKIKNAFVWFYEKVIKGIMIKIKNLAMNSVSGFLDAVGLKVHARLKMGGVT